MKLKKIGKALMTGVLSAGVVFGVSSCVQSYTVGFLYVTTTVTAQPAGEGLITGYKIDHNTGNLTKINGLPVSTGGANPVRALLTQSSRFVYVLNRGASASGSADCTTTIPCSGGNITEFAVGGNGILTPQETFFTQGINPFRMIVDGSGAYLMVLDHDAPDSNAYTGKSALTNSCTAALGSLITSCADITIFQINTTTGRLSLVENQEVTVAGVPLTYFPVPANPVDFLLSGNFVETLSSSTAQTSFPYTGGGQVFPYAYNSGTGQLTLSQNTAQLLGIAQGNAIVSGGATTSVYVLDNEPITFTSNGTVTTAPSQMLPFGVGTNGALQPQVGGDIPDDTSLGNPIQLLVESKGKFIYLANQGNNVTGPNPESGIAGYFLSTSPSFQLTFIAGEPFGSGSGPQCIVEDPSDQFVYTANEYDSSITGRFLDPNTGVLNPLRVNGDFPLAGPATWCFIDGRTS